MRDTEKRRKEAEEIKAWKKKFGRSEGEGEQEQIAKKKGEIEIWSRGQSEKGLKERREENETRKKDAEERKKKEDERNYLELEKR